MRDAVPSEGALAEGVERPESAADMVEEGWGGAGVVVGVYVLVVWVCSWLRKVFWVNEKRERRRAASESESI